MISHAGAPNDETPDAVTSNDVAGSVDQLVSAVAAYGLADSDGRIGVGVDDAAAFVDAIAKHQLSGTAIRMLIEETLAFTDNSAGEDGGSERLVSLHDKAMERSMACEVEAVRISDLLTSVGLAHRVIDGVAVAHAAYEAPALRSFDDVSILVMANDMEKVIRLLIGNGATRPTPEVRSGFDRRFAHRVELDVEGISINVHRTFCPGQFGVTMKPNDLFVLRRVIGVAGVDIPILDPTDSLAYACYVLALGSPQAPLSRVRDVAILSGTDKRLGFDAARFEDSVDRWQGRAVIRRAVRMVETELGPVLPDALKWYSNADIDTQERAALAAYVIEDDEDRAAALEVTTFKALPLADRPAYAVAAGLPDATEPVQLIKGLIARRRR